jgi:Flp pilus assembly protein TadG
MMLARLFKHKGGGVVPMLALSFVPIMAAVAGAVDYGHANWIKASLQDAVDATALMLAKSAPNLTQAQLQESASAFFLANFTRTDAQNPSVQISYTPSQNGGYNVKVDGSATVNTKFMNVLGISQLPISTTATVTWSNSKLRIALVLDNTGSMAQTDGSGTSRMSALKTAAHNLLTQLKTAAQKDGDVYVSIIPFSKDVNVGAGNYNAPWIEWTDWEAVNGTCSSTKYQKKSSCEANGKIWTPKPHTDWNGCVTDRDQNFDTNNVAPTSGSTLFPAEQYASCPVALTAMSYDWTALHNLIDNMTPLGNTNQAIGLVWGWHSLTTGAPLNSPPLDPNYQYKQVIVLLTDGLNTENRWYNSASPIDARQQTTCNNIKAAGITIYTVLVMAGSSSVLQNCATDADKYFALSNANQIITAFDTIGTSLTQLHLTK